MLCVRVHGYECLWRCVSEIEAVEVECTCNH